MFGFVLRRPPNLAENGAHLPGSPVLRHAGSGRGRRVRCFVISTEGFCIGKIIKEKMD